MHIEYLDYFRSFAKNLSISETAREYYLTPQGISRALHLLEKDFGVSLFQRRGNGVYLTPAGLEFDKKVDAVLSAYDDLQASMAKHVVPAKVLEGESIEPVYIATTSCVSSYFLGIINIHKQGAFSFPLKLSETNIYRIVPKVTPKSDEKILGIISLPTVQRYMEYADELAEKNNLVIKPIIDSPLVGVISSSSPLASRGYATVNDVQGLPVAVYQNMVLLDALDDYIREEMLLTKSNNKAIVDLQIRDSNAIGFAPKLIEGMSPQLPEGATTIRLDGFFSTRFAFMATPACFDDPKIAEVVAYICDFFRENAQIQRYSETYTLLM